MGVAAIRGSKAWLAGSAALAMGLTGTSVAVLHLAFPLTYEARALVLLEPDEAPVAALPESRSRRSPVRSRLLAGGRLVEISATAGDAEAAAAIANGAAAAFMGEASAASRAALSTARARARAAVTLTAAAAHPLDTPLLRALRRALSAMERRRDEVPGPFAVIGEAEMSARRQIAREVWGIRRSAAEELARALSREARAGRARADRPSRVLVAPASAAEAVRRASPASERDPLAGSAPALLFALLLAVGVLAAGLWAARSSMAGSLAAHRRRRA